MARLLAGQAVERTSDALNPGSAVSVGGSSTEIAAANRGRAEITVQNDHATQVVYLHLGGGAATLNAGIRLNAAGGTWTSSAYTGRIAAIATGATTGVLVTEI